MRWAKPMDSAAWLGLATGGVLGGAYAAWQLRSLRRQQLAQQRGEPTNWTRQAVDSVVRIGLLVVVLALVVMVPADRLHRGWLAGAVIVCYTVPMVMRVRWMLKRTEQDKRQQ
ncbi:MAG: hypothetical protein NZ483_00050 [Verrucomicrobiae bacterium]|nr:hypothetical protein [Verrucomicrobiae bacterium]MDW8343792.1 hypothetical protein [Verrucomicrobiae bacterium]